MNFSFYFLLSLSCLRKQLAKIGCVLSRLLSGKFLLEKCWKGGEITEDIGILCKVRMMSKDVSARRVSPVITRVKFEEQSIREERRKSYESAII